MQIVTTICGKPVFLQKPAAFMSRILFLVPYPLRQSPSQRFRFEQYLALLKVQGHAVQIQSFLPTDKWRLFYRSGHSVSKALMVVNGFIKRAGVLFTLGRYDRIFIHREAAPVGPPLIEWFIGRVLRKKIIYDFDDAIWLTDKKNERWLEHTLRSRSKVASVCTWSHIISCGNEYLRQYALRFNRNALLNPTTIDTENIHNRARHSPTARVSDRVVIAWTGSHSTLKYLYLLEGVLRHIQQQFTEVDLVVIADIPPKMDLPRIIFRPWSSETEISDLIDADIGIMPLPDDEWSKGKCGFKALQYMALEIPAVASDVGVNPEIIKDGVNGRLCSNDEHWLTALEELIIDPVLRKKLGSAGRKTVVDRYSVISNSDNFLSLFTR